MEGDARYALGAELARTDNALLVGNGKRAVFVRKSGHAACYNFEVLSREYLDFVTFGKPPRHPAKGSPAAPLQVIGGEQAPEEDPEAYNEIKRVERLSA
jgi:hypothetical protein